MQRNVLSLEDCFLQCVSLFSGSSGNAIFVKRGGTRILVDAGVSFRRLSLALSALGEELDALDGVFFTHEHADHIGALPMLLKKTRLPFYLSASSAEATYDTLLAKDPSLAAAFEERVLTLESGEEYEVGELSFSPFSLPHDSVSCQGFTFFSDDGDKLLGIATDLGEATVEARRALYGCPAVVLESNHDPEMLENGPYPPFLQARVASDTGHLSNPACAALLAALVTGGLHSALLFHLSRENNTPSLALSASRDLLRAVGAEVTVAAAAPDASTVLL